MELPADKIEAVTLHPGDRVEDGRTSSLFCPVAEDQGAFLDLLGDQQDGAKRLAFLVFLFRPGCQKG